MPEPKSASGKASSVHKEGAETRGAMGKPAANGEVAHAGVGSESEAAEDAAGAPASKVGPRRESLHLFDYTSCDIKAATMGSIFSPAS